MVCLLAWVDTAQSFVAGVADSLNATKRRLGIPPTKNSINIHMKGIQKLIQTCSDNEGDGQADRS